MTLAISTEGLVSDGGGSSTAPAISAVSPSTNTPPGSVGGMPLNYALARATAVSVLVSDADGTSSIAHVGATALFLDGSAEAVYDAGSFLGAYVAGSSQTSDASGVHLSIARASGWPAAPAASTPLAVGLRITATDFSGNVTTTTLYYQMPLASSLVPAAIVAPIIAAADLASEIRALIVWQLRS